MRHVGGVISSTHSAGGSPGWLARHGIHLGETYILGDSPLVLLVPALQSSITTLDARVEQLRDDSRARASSTPATTSPTPTVGRSGCTKTLDSRLAARQSLRQARRARLLSDRRRLRSPRRGRHRRTRPPRTMGGVDRGTSSSPMLMMHAQPSSPLPPEPQQRTWPLSKTAQVFPPPAVIAVSARVPATGPATAGISSSPMSSVFP